MILPLLGMLLGQATATGVHHFSFVAPPGAKAVSLAGTFNGWKPGATPLKRDADGRTWVVDLPLSFGKHQYKFVVDGAWSTDPSASSETDGSGNVNSVLVMLPPDYSEPARPDDGVIAESALKHEPAVPMLNWDHGKLIVSLRARLHDLKGADVVVGQRSYPMADLGGDDLYETYRASIPWSRKNPIAYAFRLDDGKVKRVFGPSGLVGGGSDGRSSPRFVLDPRTFRPFEVPSWVEKGVIYQIFPDRFDNGDPANDPKDRVAWNAEPTWFSHYGGDLAGVQRRIPYLRQLGVTTLYFNPVFLSPSVHRYDAEDFKRIDPELGTNAQFDSMTGMLHKNGMRVVMDFAFNHSATTFVAFKDLLEKQAASGYKDWYFVHKYPVKVEMPPNYEAWWGFASMPKLNVMNPPTHAYLLGVADFWQRTARIDGIRLDVPNEVAEPFWADFRKTVKGNDPNAWICGEIWGDGSPWLKGDQFDSVMNYPFRDAVVRFVAQGVDTPSQFAGRLMNVYSSYAPQVSRNLMNLIGSHDTARFLTEAGGDRDLLKLAELVQFTWVGVPSIYYGDELGMDGGKDPQNRRGMRWDLVKPDNDVFAWTRALIRIRTRVPALQFGDPIVLLADDANDTLAFARALPDSPASSALVVLNRDRARHTVSVPFPTGSAFAESQRLGFVDAFSGRRYAATKGTLSITLDGLRGAILLSATPSHFRIAAENRIPASAFRTRGPFVSRSY